MAGITLEQLRELILGAKPRRAPMPGEQQFGSLAPPGANAGPDLMTRAAVNLGAADTFDARDRLAALFSHIVPKPDLSTSVMPGVLDASQKAREFGSGLARTGSAGLVGAPVDIANIMMGGKGGEAPVMGSKWLEQKMTNAGIFPPRYGTGWESTGDIVGGFVNPVGAAMKVGPTLYNAEQAAIRNAMAGTRVVAGSPEAQIGAIGRRAAKNTRTESIAEIDFKSMTPAERQAAALNDIHLKQMPDGKYVGSPDITSGAQLGAMRKRLYNEMRSIVTKPWVGEYPPWYERQRTGVEEVAGADPLKQTRAASGIGVYSPQTNPATNYTSMANQMVHDAYTGDPFSRQRTGAQAQNFGEELAGGRQATQGPKTENFAVSSDPTRFDPDMATNDIWVGRFLGYDQGKFDRGFTGAEHGFVQGEMQRMTAIANKEKWGGKSDWHVEEMQALPWVEYKAQSLMEKRGLTYEEAIREAMKTTLEALPRNTMYLNNEVVSGPATRHVVGMIDAPDALKAQYTAEPGNFMDPSGRNVFTQSLRNMLEQPSVPFTGNYTSPATGVLNSSLGNAFRPAIERQKGLRPDPLWEAMNQPANPLQRATDTEIFPTYGTAAPAFPSYVPDVSPLALPKPGHKVLLRPPKTPKLPFPTAPTSSGLPRVAADEPFVAPSSENALQVIQHLYGGFNAQEGSVGSSFFTAPKATAPGVNAMRIDVPGTQPVTLQDILAAKQATSPYGATDAFHTGGRGIVATQFDSDLPVPKFNQKAQDLITAALPPGTDVTPGVRRSIPGAWLTSEWAQPEGSGAVTMRMLEAIDKDPVQGAYLLRQFDANPQVREHILATIPRDERYSTMTQTPTRADLQKLRADAAKEGLYDFFARIRKSGAAGYPALALGLLAPELLDQGGQGSPYQ